VRFALRSALLVVAIVSCKRPPTEAPPLLSSYPIRPHVRWTEVHDDSGKVQKRAREERWTKTGDGTWDVETTDVETGTVFYRARYALTKEGLAQTAVLDGPKVVPVEPPRVALPSPLTIGAEWERAHRVGAQRSDRSCRVREYDKCRGGIDVQCTTTYADGRIVEVHNRYCEGVGIVAYRSTTGGVGADRVVRIWSEDLRDVAAK
jgi:hypothetical protein